MSGYGIICRARAGKGITRLALVDRTKTRRLWWTSDDPAIAICYESKSAAEFACSRLKKNSPRVVAFDEVCRMLHGQADTRRELEAEWERDYALSSSEAGWDGHKDFLP